MIHELKYTTDVKIYTREASKLEVYKDILFYKKEEYIKGKLCNTNEGIIRKNKLEDCLSKESNLRYELPIPFLEKSFFTKEKDSFLPVNVFRRKDYLDKMEDIFSKELDSRTYITKNGLCMDTGFIVKNPYSSEIEIDGKEFDFISISEYQKGYTQMLSGEVLDKVVILEDIFFELPKRIEFTEEEKSILTGKYKVITHDSIDMLLYKATGEEILKFITTNKESENYKELYQTYKEHIQEKAFKKIGIKGGD